MALICCAASWLKFAFLYLSWFSCRSQWSFLLDHIGILWEFCVILFLALRSWASRRVASLRWFVDWLVPWAIPGWWEPLWLVKDDLQEFFGVHKPQAIAAFFFRFLIEVCEVLSDLWSQCLKRNRGRCLSHTHAFAEIPVRRSDAMEVPGGLKKGRGYMHRARCVRNSFAMPIHAKGSRTPTHVWALKIQENPPTLRQLALFWATIWLCGLPFRWSLASLASAQGCNFWEFSWWGWFLPRTRWEPVVSDLVRPQCQLAWFLTANVQLQYVRTPDHQKPIWLMLCVAWHVTAILQVGSGNHPTQS